jgi:hypothetical protein
VVIHALSLAHCRIIQSRKWSIQFQKEEKKNESKSEVEE